MTPTITVEMTTTTVETLEWVGGGRNPGVFCRFEGRTGSLMISRSLRPERFSEGDRVRVTIKPGGLSGRYIAEIEHA